MRDAETRTVSINVPVSYAVTSVTASADDGNKPENVIDGDYNTRWSAQGAYCMLTLELPQLLPIGYVGVAWYVGNERTSSFEIELSENGTDYHSVFKGQSALTLNMTGYDAGVENARFVRIACMGNSESLWNSITEVKIYPPLKGGGIAVENAGLDGASLKEPSAELLKALSAIDKSYDTALLDYIASMYGTERGMFFYSSSARDNEGFASDIESTSQAVNILKYLGVRNTAYMPENFISKMAESIQKCQSDEGLGSSFGTMSLGEWYTLRIDYTPKNGKSVLYIDSSPKGSSLSYYSKSDGKTPVTKIDGFSFATFKSAKADVYIDNISLSFN